VTDASTGAGGDAGGLVNASSAQAVILTGEVLNTSALRLELGLDASVDEGAVLAAGWARWSTGVFERLAGVHAVVLRMPAGETVGYGDPSGLRHLRWCRNASGQAEWAACAGALSRRAGKRALDRLALHEYLRFLEVTAPRTLWRDVASAPAGVAMRVEMSTDGLLALPAWPAEATPRTFADALDALSDRLGHAVDMALDGAERPAAFLSGGIDSALICALASRRRPDLTAVTVGFEGQTHDEAPAAAAVAAQLGIRHEVLRPSRQALLEAFGRLSRESDQPLADPAAMATLLVFEACRQRFDVTLDGTGADEAVGLMPPRHARIATAYASLLPKAARLATAGALRRLPGWSRYAPLFDFEHPADMLARWKGFSRREIEALCDTPVSLAHTRFHRTFEGFPRHAHFERYSALLDAMTCERLNQALALSGACVRFPFWDAAVQRLVRRLPLEHRYLPGQPKRVLRGLLARHVPPAIWQAPKRGFSFALADFLVADDHALIREYLLPGPWPRWRILDAAAVQRMGSRFMMGDPSVLFRVWALVVLAAWLQAHEDQLDLE
jgi:asparagine synthase (glutamine-hydrolysing)